MYAVFQMAGFQHSAVEGAIVRVPKQSFDGKKVTVTDVLLVKDKDSAHVGTPFVPGASVVCEVVGAGKTAKTIVHKYKKRTKYRRTSGHRQDFIDLKVTKIHLKK